VRLLKGFERLTLAPGEKKTVTFPLAEKELSFWSPQARRWVEEPEQFDIWAGDDSTAQLHSSLQVSLASN
jgi:beta-glucosidase